MTALKKRLDLMKRVATLCIFCALIATNPAHAERKSPVDGGSLTSSPGWRLDPFGSGRTVWHNGWDIAVPTGTPVYPTQAGTVYFAGQYKGYGKRFPVASNDTPDGRRKNQRVEIKILSMNG